MSGALTQIQKDVAEYCATSGASPRLYDTWAMATAFEHHLQDLTHEEEAALVSRRERATPEGSVDIALKDWGDALVAAWGAAGVKIDRHHLTTFCDTDKGATAGVMHQARGFGLYRPFGRWRVPFTPAVTTVPWLPMSGSFGGLALPTGAVAVVGLDGEGKSAFVEQSIALLPAGTCQHMPMGEPGATSQGDFRALTAAITAFLATDARVLMIDSIRVTRQQIEGQLESGGVPAPVTSLLSGLDTVMRQEGRTVFVTLNPEVSRKREDILEAWWTKTASSCTIPVRALGVTSGRLSFDVQVREGASSGRVTQRGSLTLGAAAAPTGGAEPLRFFQTMN